MGSSTSYVYWQSEPGLWTVGFYSPDGERHPESDHTTREAAAERVHYLNGGMNVKDIARELGQMQRMR